MPNRSHKVLPLPEKVKSLDLIGKKAKFAKFAEFAKIYSKTGSLWNRERGKKIALILLSHLRRIKCQAQSSVSAKLQWKKP